MADVISNSLLARHSHLRLGIGDTINPGHFGYVVSFPFISIGVAAWHSHQFVRDNYDSRK